MLHNQHIIGGIKVDSYDEKLSRTRNESRMIPVMVITVWEFHCSLDHVTSLASWFSIQINLLGVLHCLYINMNRKKYTSTHTYEFVNVFNSFLFLLGIVTVYIVSFERKEIFFLQSDTFSRYISWSCNFEQLWHHPLVAFHPQLNLACSKVKNSSASTEYSKCRAKKIIKNYTFIFIKPFPHFRKKLWLSDIDKCD